MDTHEHIRRLTRTAPDPDDASQAVWEKLIRLRATDRGPAWVATVARHELIDRHRRRAVRPTAPLVLEPAVHPACPAETASVRQALRQLPATWVQALVRHHVLGETVGELARSEGVSPSTIKTRLVRGRRRLAALLAVAMVAVAAPSPTGTPTPERPLPAVLNTAEQQPDYNPIGKRDPFRSFLPRKVDRPFAGNPLQRYPVDRYAVTGVVWGQPATAMVRDPHGESFLLEQGTYIGNNWGKVTSIHHDRVVVTEEYQTIDGQLVVLTEELLLQPLDHKAPQRP